MSHATSVTPSAPMPPASQAASASSLELVPEALVGSGAVATPVAPAPHDAPLTGVPPVGDAASATDVAPASFVVELPDATATPGLSITAQEMTRLTGVARERLRTWERRHGFPIAVRSRNNVRRYSVDDVRHVAAVSQLATNGVPLAEAIQTVLGRRDAPSTLESLGAALDHAPAPAIAIAGPAPLQVVWANGATRVSPRSPAIGTELTDRDPILGHSAREAVRRLLAGSDAMSCVISHGDWMGNASVPRQSIAWRLPSVTTGQPVVILMQLPEPTMGAALPGGDYQRDAGRWAAGLGAARRPLQDGVGLSSLQQALRGLVDEARVADGFLALFQGDQMRTATSVRGTLTPRAAELVACPEIGRAVAELEVDWLGDEALAALGIDPRLTAAAIPLVASGEKLGVAVLVFNTPTGLGEGARELLLAFGAMAATTLLRERTARATAGVTARQVRARRSAGAPGMAQGRRLAA